MMTPKQIHALLKNDRSHSRKVRRNPDENDMMHSGYVDSEGSDGEKSRRRRRRSRRPVANNSHVRVGNRVKVMRPQKPFFGTVKRISAKSFSVTADNGKKWRIPLTYPLTVVKPSAVSKKRAPKMSKDAAEYMRIRSKMNNYKAPFYKFVSKVVNDSVNHELRHFGKKKDPRRPYIFTAETANSAYSVVTIQSPQAMANMVKAVRRKYPKADVYIKRTTHRSEID